MSNLSELMEFLVTNRSKTLTNEHMPTYRFDASIRYEWKQKSKIFPATVRVEVNGYCEGNIQLHPKNKDVSENTFHLDFTEKWQTYIFNKENNSLEIKGESDKMGGKYAVEIHLQ